MRVTLIILGTVISLLVLAFFIYRVPDMDREILRKKYANSSSEFIAIDGQEVHYRQEGTGPFLLLLHGTSSSLHTWDQWTLLLKDYFTVVRLDLPAYGLTGPFPDDDYSTDHYVTFLNEFVHHLEIDTFHLAGNSFGGLLAWNFALAYPEKVKKLILIDASGYPGKETPILFQLARNPLAAFALKSITPRSFVEDNIKEVYHQDELISDTLVDRYYELMLHEGNRQAFIDRANLDRKDRSEMISKISQPTLIQWGQHDLWIPVSDGHRFARDIPKSQLIVYKNAGHLPMEEIPLTTVSDAVDFLQN